MMDSTKQPEDWELESIQNIYKLTHGLTLGIEQAKQLYNYEQIKKISSTRHFFSQWEEWDYEWTVFKEILDDEQYGQYEKLRIENIGQYVQTLIEEDQKLENEFAYYNELLKFYTIEFWPDIIRGGLLATFNLSIAKVKIQYLREEYKLYLGESKLQILTNHFRKFRTHKPNALKLSLLKHELSEEMPDYWSFIQAADEPLKVTAKYLASKFQRLPELTQNLAGRKFEELRIFSEENRKRHFGEIKGWHFTLGPISDEEKREVEIMTLLLFDRPKSRPLG